MKRQGGLRLSVELGLVSTLTVALVCVAMIVVWVRHVREVIVDETRDEAVALAVALASSHYADVASKNDAQIQLDLAAVAERTPDVAYLMATDASEGDAVTAAIPTDVIGSVVPDLVPLAVTDAAAQGTGTRVQSTVLLRNAYPGAHAGDRVIDVTEDIRLRDGTRIGRLRAGILVRKQDAALDKALRSAVLIGAAILAAAVLAVVLLARSVAAPVAALGARMTRVRDGELAPHATDRGPTEVRALAAAYNEMIAGLLQKRALERYVPLGARRAIDSQGGGEGVVAPRRERAVVLFADLRGFSTLSEKRTPSEVLALLTEYTDAMADVVRSSGGDVNELLGDAVLAVFSGDGAPADAVRCAARMQRRLRQIGDGELRMGVGLHVGDVVTGTVGTGDRLKFAVVGDTVNVAARIQERARGADTTCVLASDDVMRAAGDAFRWRDVGEMPVRGREGRMHVWELEAGAE
jgi:class 3 adenylate cyclase